MNDYKTEKEAFVSGNEGESILSINITSFVALTSYLCYILSSKRSSPSFVKDYVTTILPLLLSVTIFSSRPLLLNFGLLFLTWWTYPKPRPALHSNGHAPGAEQSQDLGRWLEESDSDEEDVKSAGEVPPAVPAQPSRVRVLLPSRAVDGESTPPRTPPGRASPTTPEGSMGMSQKPWRRRHNPTPSTHTHTAIDILPTPELPSSSSRSSSLLSESNDPTSSSEQSPGQVSVPGAGDKLSFLSVYRAHMMIMTVHCILAVDFPVFPRRQGKCEDFGASLMDVGVGSFVFSLGLVSARKLVGSQVSNDNIFLKISQSIWKSLPTLVLGLVRVLMVKGSEYPEHVTEYGVHWNFFFTLAILPVIGISLRPVCQLVGWTQAGLLVAVLHQSALSSSGFNLQSWILSPDRNGLIEMNKEGLVSLPGYLAIYLLGVAIGQHVMRAAAPAKRVESATEKAEERIKRHYEQRRANLAMELVSFGLGWWSLLAFSRFMGVEVSRRMANSAYVLWVAGYNTLFLLGYLLLEIYLLEIPVPPHAVPPLLDAINRNGLMVFLIANLLTGVVNLSFKTMYLSNYQAMCILILYSIAVSAIAWTARYWKVNL